MREDPGVGRSGWLAVVPIKPLPAAKSRLRGAVAGVPHERLVLAMAKDTVAATLACGRVDRVVVVTDDPLAGAALAASGAAWVRDLPRAGPRCRGARGRPAGGPPRGARGRARRGVERRRPGLRGRRVRDGNGPAHRPVGAGPRSQVRAGLVGGARALRGHTAVR